MTAGGWRLAACGFALVVASCATPLRNLASGKTSCTQLATWAAEKGADRPQRPGESSAQDDAAEAAACYRRQNDLAGARSALLSGLIADARDAARPAATKAGGFEDGLARKVAALALSAAAAGDQANFDRAKSALTTLRGRELELERGDKRAVGSAGEAVSMVDGECFFCARPEAYGAQDGEHVEQLGRWAGYSYVRRDDGREQFLVATRLIAEGQRPPAQQFAEAMRRRGRRIEASSPAFLVKRTPGDGEDVAVDAPLFQLTLRGFAFGDVERASKESGELRPGLHLIVHSEAGDLAVRFSPLLLQRAQRDRRFVAPPDGVDAVVRFEGKDGERPRYRAVIMRFEDGIAEGP